MSEDIKIQPKPKRKMTEKQKAARLANLESARKKRSETIKDKKESEKQEFDLSSQESEQSGDESESDEDFVISKRKKINLPVNKKNEKPKEIRSKKSVMDDYYHQRVEDLESMVETLAKLQKKQAKRKTSNRSSGGTKIVVLPNTSQTKSPMNDSVMEALRKSLM